MTDQDYVCENCGKHYMEHELAFYDNARLCPDRQVFTPKPTPDPKVVKTVSDKDAIAGLHRIFDSLQEKFHDEWEWMDAYFYVEVLKAYIEHGAEPKAPTEDDVAASNARQSEFMRNCPDNYGGSPGPKAPDVIETSREHLCETGVRDCAWARRAEKAERERDAALAEVKRVTREALDLAGEVVRFRDERDQLQRDLDAAKELLTILRDTLDSEGLLAGLCARVDNLLK